MKLVYFAWVREKAGMSGEDVSPPDGVADVAALIDWLKGRGAGYADAFADLRLIRVAVNQHHVDFDHPVTAADEVAFFPPVTGG
ncbi:MAG: molybdopterin converting factor subunit 1 [Alphaproteobacteria bacterium]